MKKVILIIIVVSFFISCGPHRMRCGARGICKSPGKSETILKNS